MPSGTIVGTASIPQREDSPLQPLADFSDSVALSASVSSGDWLTLIQVGGYPWATDCGAIGPPFIPFIAESAVGNVVFEQIDHASFADSGVVGEWNQDVNPIGFLSDPGGCPSPRTTAYVDNTYPNLAYTLPGVLSAGISLGDDITIDWHLPTGIGIVEAYTALVVKIVAPFDQLFNEPIWLEGTSFSGASSEGFNSGTTSYPVVTHATSSAAAGKGAVCLAAIAWDDTSIVPTLTSGWTILTNYADMTTGWASLLAGRQFSPGDTGTYTLTATFSSSVKSTCMCDTWQTLAGEGLHVWQRT
jgi:hypothetical protein